MLKTLLVLALAGTAFARLISPRSDQDSPQSSPVNDSTDQEDNSPVFLPEKEETKLPISQYPYPTYPDYSGYANQLVPAIPPRNAPSATWASTIASSLVPLGSFALSYGTHAIIYGLQFVALVVVGVFLTTLICTFTPVCSITFDGLGLNKYQVVCLFNLNHQILF